MKIIFPAAILLICLFGCAEKKNISVPLAPLQDTTIEVQAKFFPVTEFLEGQIALFDSMPVTPLHFIMQNDKTDSQWIKREELKSYLKTFITPEINDSNLTKYFNESKFNDRTIGAVTLMYLPKTILPDSIPLMMWNVYINPQKAKVVKIYIQKHVKEKNQDIIEQLTWQVDKYAEIVDIINTPANKSAVLKREKFLWDFN